MTLEKTKRRQEYYMKRKILAECGEKATSAEVLDELIKLSPEELEAERKTNEYLTNKLEELELR